MSEDFVLELGSLTAKIVLVVSTLIVPALPQETAGPPTTTTSPVAALPDAPSAQDPEPGEPRTQDSVSTPTSSPALQGPIGPVPALLTKGRLTLNDKFNLFAHQAFGPPALIFPAIGAGIRMADPPKNYPREWVDGGGAFGRLYGNALATQTSKRTAAFLAAAVLHEDPRYLPAPEGANLGERIFHAVAFTLVDRTDSGGHTLAFSNFAAAAAGGFVGMAYLPNGFNDSSHAEQRAASELLGLAIANVSREFAPQWVPIVRKLHIPKIVPAWWVTEHPQHP
jgi:hypothetical protein